MTRSKVTKIHRFNIILTNLQHMGRVWQTLTAMYCKYQLNFRWVCSITPIKRDSQTPLPLVTHSFSKCTAATGARRQTALTPFTLLDPGTGARREFSTPKVFQQRISYIFLISCVCRTRNEKRGTEFGWRLCEAHPTFTRQKRAIPLPPSASAPCVGRSSSSEAGPSPPVCPAHRTTRGTGLETCAH